MIVDWQLIDWGQDDDSTAVPASRQAFQPHEFNLDAAPRTVFVFDKGMNLFADNSVRTFYVD